MPDIPASPRAIPRRPGVGPEEEGARAYLFQIVRTRALAA